MPTSSDLVTDLPADFEVFGQAVDTSLADLKGGTTGQVLKKNSNTDMDFVWGTDSAGMTNPMTTTGDTIYSSSGSTPARLGIGTTGQVLTVSGGLPAWATPAGNTLAIAQIATGTLSGSSVTISSLSSYDNLFLSVWGVEGASAPLRVRPNGSTSTVYQYQGNAGTASEVKRIQQTGNDQFDTYYSLRSVGGENAFTYHLTNCKATGFTNVALVAGYDNSSAVGAWDNFQGIFKSAAAVSSLVISIAGTFTAGTYTLWGA